jgi:hypothetical protein
MELRCRRNIVADAETGLLLLFALLLLMLSALVRSHARCCSGRVPSSSMCWVNGCRYSRAEVLKEPLEILPLKGPLTSCPPTSFTSYSPSEGSAVGEAAAAAAATAEDDDDEEEEAKVVRICVFGVNFGWPLERKRCAEWGR